MPHLERPVCGRMDLRAQYVSDDIFIDWACGRMALRPQYISDGIFIEWPVAGRP